MKNIEIIKQHNKYYDRYYETGELPFDIWVKNVNLDKNRNYFCDQKGSKLRCLLKLTTSKDQAFYENFGCDLGELFAEYTNKFLENNFVERPMLNLSKSKIKPKCNIKFLTQHSEIVDFDVNKYSDLVKIYNENRNKDNKRVLNYATLIYCFTEDYKDIQNFQLRLVAHNDFNDSLSSWLEYFDIDKTLKEMPEEDKQKIKERLVYSFLFRNCFNDSDYSPRNFGLLFDKRKITLAPNFDYGEFLNSVKVGKFYKLQPVDLNSFPEMDTNIREALIKEMIESNEKRKMVLKNITPEELAGQDVKDPAYLCNIKYACKYYPHVVYQFIDVIKKLKNDEVEFSVISNILNKYKINNGEYKILDKEKFDFIKDYITVRIDKFVEMLETRLNHYVCKRYIENKEQYIQNKAQEKTK